LVAARHEHEGLSQARLARLMGVSANTVCSLEKGWGRDGPTLVHLTSWARLVGFRMVVVDVHAGWLSVPLVRKAGEGRDALEVRRLLVTLRGVREGGRPRRTQAEVARRAGVSKSSIRHWECLVGEPRAVGFMRWVLALGCAVELRPWQGSESVT